MMPLNRAIAWAGVAAAELFMFANVRTTDTSAGYVFLGIAAICTVFVVVTRADPGRAAVAQRSAFFLLAFMTYFAVKLLVDLRDIEEIRGYSLGTSDGVMFAFLFGWVLSVLVTATTDEGVHGLGRLLPTGLLLAVSLVLALLTFVTHLHHIRSDLFLVQGSRGLYQRPGSFAVMIALVASMQLAFALEKRTRSVATRIAGALTITVYLVLLATLMATTQLIGSNTGFIVTLYIALGTMLWIWRRDLATWRGRTLLHLRPPSLQAILKQSMPRLVLNGVVLTALAGALGFASLHYARIDYHSLRIFGFSEGSVGSHSLRERLDILSRDFATQFNYAPVFGNFRVDTLTTGSGTYAHSLLSLFSHLGLVGAALFTVYLAILYQELKRPRSGSPFFYTSVEFGLFRGIILVGVVGYSLIGTFLTWMPLWFALGLLFPPFIMRRVPGSADYRSSSPTARAAASPVP